MYIDEPWDVTGVGENHTSSGYKSPIFGAEDYVLPSELAVLE